jgi:hypothetical protein
MTSDELVQRCLDQALRQITELQTRGTELVLENRELKARLAQLETELPGPRRTLWMSCGECGRRAPHPTDIEHKPGCLWMPKP